MEITSNTRIIDLTVGQLMELFAKAQAPATITEAPERRNALCMAYPELRNYSIAA